MRAHERVVCAFVVGVAILGAAASAIAQPALKPVRCDPADNETRVSGGKECLVIRTYRASPPATDPVLLVFIHGDGSSGGPSDYLYRTARAAAVDGRVGIALLRPEYFDRDGNQSTGSNYYRQDSYTPRNIDAVAAAITTLREHHHARRVVLVGHSGGGVFAGVILGRHTGLADGAIIAACGCDVAAWRARQNRRPWLSSLSASNYVKKVPVTARVIVLTGSLDDNATPRIGRDYVADLVKHGVAARFVEVSGAGHDDVMRRPELRAAIEEIVSDLAKQE